MSKIEVQCRYKKLLGQGSQEDKAYLESLRIVQNKDSIDDVEVDDEERFEYGPMVLDTNDIRAFNMVDRNHTCLRVYEGDAFVIKIPYPVFIELYEELESTRVNRVEWEEVKEIDA